jgi:hypothetical protein
VVNGESLPISHRRALAISEDDHPSDFLYHAPLPGDHLDVPAPFSALPIDPPEADDEPIGLSELAHTGSNDDPDWDFKMTAPDEPQLARPAPQHDPRELEPLPFGAPSPARLEAEPEPELEQRAEPETRLQAVSAEEPVAARSDWQTAPLEGLGLMQLVQRLGSTIERRRELMAIAAAQAPARPAAFAQPDFEPAAPEDAVHAIAAYFGSAPALKPEPAAPAPRPEFTEEDDGEEAISDFSLPLSRPAAPADNDEAHGGKPGYGSLLGMDNPPGKAPAPQVPVDADAALRAALATLQRMSGAA